MNNNIRIAALAIPFAFLSVPFAASAADTGELWESSVVMNIPGMPAGMGAQKSRVCTDKNESPGAGRKECKVSNLKRSGLTESMTVTCPDGRMTVEMTYNAARTEYKGTMKMDDMVMNLTGRKVGACDPQVAQQQRNEQAEKAKAQGAAASAQANRMLADTRQQQLDGFKKSCAEAVTTMEPGALAHALCVGSRQALASAMHCSANMDAKSREMMMPAEAKAFCETKRTEFCRRLQTEAGYQKATRIEVKLSDRESILRTGRRSPEAERDDERAAENLKEASQLCGLQPAKVTAGVCARAVKAESLNFLNTFCPAEFKQVVAAKCSRAVKEEQLEFIGTTCPAEAKQLGAAACPKAIATDAYSYVGRYCPADAKALYAKHCAGRTYTSVYAKNPKMLNLCASIETARNADEEQGQTERRQPAAAKSGGSPAASAAPAEKKRSATDTATDSVNQGINKLKGLFGR